MKFFITPFNFSFWRSNSVKSAAFQIKAETAGKLIEQQMFYLKAIILVIQHTESKKQTVLQSSKLFFIKHRRSRLYLPVV
jgi:hypothetical protein